MNLLSDIITYVRRIIKTPSNSNITDGLIIDYINRFYTCDVPARIQLFDLKTKYNLELQANVDQYNMPYTPSTSYQIGAETYTISPYPMYQGFIDPVYIDGIQVNLMTSRSNFFKTYPNFVYNLIADVGDGVTTSYTFSQSFVPVIRGHVDVTGEITNASSLVTPISSLNSGVFVNSTDSNNNLILLQDSPWTATMLNGLAPFGVANSNIGYLVSYNRSSNTYTQYGTIDYTTATFTISFPTAPANGQNINTQYASGSAGTPRIAMWWNNILAVRPIPDKTYLLECDAYLTPAAFLNTGQGVTFNYMSEYLARGAARKILADVGDMEQMQMYEPFFREQEMNVLRRSDRINTQNRTSTIFTELLTQAPTQFSGQQST